MLFHPDIPCCGAWSKKVRIIHDESLFWGLESCNQDSPGGTRLFRSAGNHYHPQIHVSTPKTPLAPPTPFQHPLKPLLQAKTPHFPCPNHPSALGERGSAPRRDSESTREHQGSREKKHAEKLRQRLCAKLYFHIKHKKALRAQDRESRTREGGSGGAAAVRDEGVWSPPSQPRPLTGGGGPTSLPWQRVRRRS